MGDNGHDSLQQGSFENQQVFDDNCGRDKASAVDVGGIGKSKPQVIDGMDIVSKTLPT